MRTNSSIRQMTRNSPTYRHRCRKQWAPAKNPTKDDRDTAAWWQRQFENDRKLTGEMHRAGVRLLAGSDSLDRYNFVGTSIHQELQMLVGAGLTPIDALRTATLNPAEFLARAQVGTHLRRLPRGSSAARWRSNKRHRQHKQNHGRGFAWKILCA